MCDRFFGPNNFKRIVLVSVEYLEQIIIVPYLITSLWTRFSDPAAKKRTWATPTAIDKFKWIFVISDLITLGKQQNIKVLEHSSFCFVITSFTCLSFYLSICLLVPLLFFQKGKQNFWLWAGGAKFAPDFKEQNENCIYHDRYFKCRNLFYILTVTTRRW